MGEDENNQPNSESKISTFKFKDIDYNILIGAAERYNELKFSVVKSKYPNVNSMKEFLTSDKYLGNSVIEITYFNDIKGKEAVIIYQDDLKLYNQVVSKISKWK